MKEDKTNIPERKVELASDRRDKGEKRERRKAGTQTRERERGPSREGRGWCPCKRPAPAGPEGPESQQDKGKGHKRKALRGPQGREAQGGK